jgi:acyl-CoA synthetase (AMP-forming)/AMP-acid ligase II
LAGLNLRDFFERTVSAVPDRPFLVTRESSLSYADAGWRVDKAASAWSAFGVGKGDRVAFILENSADFVIAWLGLAKLGAVLVALNPRFTPAEVATSLELARVRFT